METGKCVSDAQMFCETNLEDIRACLTSEVELIRPLLRGAKLDVQLCLDNVTDPESGEPYPKYWIIRLGDNCIDEDYNDCCATGTVSIDTDIEELLNSLIDQL